MIVLKKDRGARVKSSFIWIGATKKEGGTIDEGIIICMWLLPGGIENIYITVTLG